MSYTRDLSFSRERVFLSYFEKLFSKKIAFKGGGLVGMDPTWCTK